MENDALIIVLIGWMLATATPGPATLSVIACALAEGRKRALVMSAGIVTGSAVWGIVAALGVGAFMYGNEWLMEVVRYLGAAYLLYLAYKSAKKAFQPHEIALPANVETSLRRSFTKGFLIHLFNPKAVLQWGALFAIVIPVGSNASQVITVFITLLSGSVFVFCSYALAFSNPVAIGMYSKARRYLELGFASVFGFASFKLLTTRSLAGE